MKYVYWTCAIFISLILQDRILILGVSVNLTTLLAYYGGIRYGHTRGLLLGALIGALEDSITSSFLGPHLLSKGIIGYTSSFFVTGGVFRWTPLLGIVAVLLLTFMDNSVVFVTNSIFDKTPAAISSAFYISVLQSILNAPAGLFIRPASED